MSDFHVLVSEVIQAMKDEIAEMRSDKPDKPYDLQTGATWWGVLVGKLEEGLKNELGERDWSEQFAAERMYKKAEICLHDALFLENEKDHLGEYALVSSALHALEVIGRVCGINGQKLIERKTES